MQVLMHFVHNSYFICFCDTKQHDDLFVHSFRTYLRIVQDVVSVEDDFYNNVVVFNNVLNVFLYFEIFNFVRNTFHCNRDDFFNFVNQVMEVCYQNIDTKIDIMFVDMRWSEYVNFDNLLFFFFRDLLTRIFNLITSFIFYRLVLV